MRKKVEGARKKMVVGALGHGCGWFSGDVVGIVRAHGGF